MFSLYSGRFDLHYFNSLEKLPAKLKAIIRLFKWKQISHKKTANHRAFDQQSQHKVYYRYL